MGNVVSMFLGFTLFCYFTNDASFCCFDSVVIRYHETSSQDYSRQTKNQQKGSDMVAGDVVAVLAMLWQVEMGVELTADWQM